jgi:hypothetical protein
MRRDGAWEGAVPSQLIIRATKGLGGRGKSRKYRHAQLSAVRLAGDLNAKMDNATLDELLDNIKSELTTLAPLIGWEVVTSAPQAGAEGGLTVGSRASEQNSLSRA